MRDALRAHFVCMDYDATENGGLPSEKYRGLAHLRYMWDVNPWSRVTYSFSAVIEPEGQYELSSGPKRPFSRPNQALLFQLMLEESLARFARIRSHERGSRGEWNEIRRLEAKIAREWRTKHKGLVDPYLRTKYIFQSGGFVERRFPGVLEQPNPQVRKRAIELIADYAVTEGDEGFRPGGKWSYWGDAIALRLEDEEATVRVAAAKALFSFQGEPVPDVDDVDLVAAARSVRSV